ncbi:LOW QUALITY PROTEIN: riboflavin-binding protein-like [Gadus chalcogrammus]|uniref:LOW QUALITY PROTEIN: riboflavin-binding protein-like n=1 Tax=Gadus chalcogrammus TaxID=1042646 RepID=UPI0024C4CD8B|nr:LOW QUALITY PROTEIN: riboflavin-binding protein-like [Gadus chalcogrammus]
MMVTMATPLLLALLVGALPSRAFGEGACLQDGKHKTTPSAEPQLTECSLYTDNACCTVEDVQDIAHVPALSNKNAPWDHCGHLSSTCEVFLKRVSCFYRCSPDAARWPHPRRRSYIQAVPLCHSFCRDWFDACRMDLTCARNWARDPRGHNCTGTCVQYQQMYQHGRDLCESLWGDAFMTVEDQVEEEEGGHHDGVHGNDGPPGDGHPGDSSRPCGCLTLSSSDRDVMAALRAQSVDPEELDTTKSGLPQYRAPCQAPPPRPTPRPPPPGRRGGGRAKAALRKRSVAVEDAEGSGSGM